MANIDSMFFTQSKWSHVAGAYGVALCLRDMYVENGHKDSSTDTSGDERYLNKS